MNPHHSPSRQAGDAFIVARAQRQVQTFFDELKNGTRNYRTVASLDTQIAQEYRGRCILELLQNAHDALANAESDDPRRISFILSTSPKPVLLIGNSGRPFRHKDFKGICELGQSPKDPNESVGNKGLGFRSVLEVSTCPEIWSTTPKGSDTSFVFRFDPSVSEQMATAAREIERQGLSARSPFDPERPLVDWWHEQLEQYRKRLSGARLDGAHEARKFLSPYTLPLTIQGVLPQVEKLLNEGHATVIQLCLDGGRGGTWQKAVQSVKDQLQKLDAKSTIFLHHLETLVIDIDGKRRVMERIIDSADKLPDCQRTQQQRLLVGQSGPTPDNNTTRQFQVWTRNVGGKDYPEQAERIRAAVEHLPNRWTEVRRVTVGVAVEEAPTPEQGVFVIFLPTETTTGMGAHINAPFYGSLDRRHINFDDSYNELLLESVLDLCIDVAMWLISGEVEGWRARAVIDVLSSTTTVDGWNWRIIMDDILEQASKRGQALNNRALILCDDGWRLPSEARVMPDLPDDSPISADHWREHAGFAIVSTALDGRLDAVKALIKALDGSPDPTNQEWQKSIERMATQLQDHSIDATWDDFLTSLVSILPANLQSEPRAGARDPLAVAKFLPTQDGRLLSASDSTKLFFRPMRGVEDVAEFAEEVPDTVKSLIAFLHRDIRTREEGPQGRNTKVQKFLDRRFARTFEREELLRTILEALPPPPVSHDGPETDSCSELFAWAMKLLGDEELESLLPLIKRLPVACHGGWFAMSDATFGPDWPDRLGELVWSLADQLPDEAAKRLRKTALLSPDDPRWGVVVKNRCELFARAGVVDGLRLQLAPKISFEMSGYGNHRLPSTPPINTPQKAWNEWCDAVRKEAKPDYKGWFEYELSNVLMLPEIHHMTGLSSIGRQTLSRLVLASLEHWHVAWESAVIEKTSGNSWSTRITSPLKYWLKTLAWLNDRTDVKQPLERRWLIPESLLRGQQERYSHLAPLSLELARRLSSEPTLKDSLVRLGLNVYPTEDDRTGPELLDALATAWVAGRVPSERFDVFLGQVRDAWRHLDPDKGLPDKFLLRTGRRTFSTRDGSNLVDVYLPDDRDRTRALQEHRKHILEMRPPDARRKANALAATNIKRASRLEERFLIDGAPWTEEVDGIPPLDETRYATWLPITLLTIAAHGGASPTGVTTETWRTAADRLRRAHVLECEAIITQLVDDDQTVASSEPEAQWLPGNVLAIRRDVELSYEKLASAAQALLDRQDLLIDLRLVLGTLASQETPTLEQIEAALEPAEIDSQAFADVRHRWAGNVSVLVDRIRPVLALFGVTDGFDAAAADTEHLRKWLSSNLSQWPAEDVISEARQSRDDYAMGLATWRALGDDIAQLPDWNKALASLGDRYEAVKNRHVDEQTQAHLEEATPLLRSLARHIADKTDNPDLFPRLETVHQNFKGSSDWSILWWEVPFGVVIDNLHACYAEILSVEHHIEVLKGAANVDDLRTKFQRCGIAIDFDPYETADTNKTRFEEVLRQVHDLHLSWLELRTSDPIAPEPESQAVIDPTAYLYGWSDTELLKRALSLIDDIEFVKVCDGCANVDEIRKCLGVGQEKIDDRREERARREREAERKQRTFKVAGEPFEIGVMSYRMLFDRISRFPDPEVPRANKDEFAPLSNTQPSSGSRVEVASRVNKTLNQRPSPELRGLVGVVGEIHAYRYLQARFGNDIVNRDSWVSEIRLKVLPTVGSELDTTSDGYGFDFRFRYGRKKWHVEVKATTGDDPQFELGITEIEAATRLARKRGELWRILRVRNALSDNPGFDWLPNPFENGFKKLFRLDKGGMKVSYTRKKT